MKIALINNKGGTGKTTTCVNLAASLATAGLRVLVTDLDAQASASLSLGIPTDQLSPSVADVLFDGGEAGSALRTTGIDGVDLLSGGMELASADLILGELDDRESRLKSGLETLQDSYDVVLMDCPPSLSMLSINALVAADAYLVAVTAEYLALEGLVSMLQAVNKAKAGLEIGPELVGIVFTMVMPGLKTSRQIIQLVRDEFGDKVFQTVIRRSVKLAEAPSFGQSIFQYAPRSSGAADYSALAAEFRSRCRIRSRKGQGRRWATSGAGSSGSGPRPAATKPAAQTGGEVNENHGR